MAPREYSVRGIASATYGSKEHVQILQASSDDDALQQGDEILQEAIDHPEIVHGSIWTKAELFDPDGKKIAVMCTKPRFLRED